MMVDADDSSEDIDTYKHVLEGEKGGETEITSRPSYTQEGWYYGDLTLAKVISGGSSLMRFLMFLSFPFFFFGGLMVLKGAPLLVQLQALTQREHVKLTKRSNIDEQRLQNSCLLGTYFSSLAFLVPDDDHHFKRLVYYACFERAESRG